MTVEGLVSLFNGYLNAPDRNESIVDYKNRLIKFAHCDYDCYAVALKILNKYDLIFKQNNIKTFSEVVKYFKSLQPDLVLSKPFGE